MVCKKCDHGIVLIQRDMPGSKDLAIPGMLHVIMGEKKIEICSCCNGKFEDCKNCEVEDASHSV